MKLTVERGFSKKGYVYSTKSNCTARANYTMGFLLRKIEVYNQKELIYTFKQENVLLKLILNIFRWIYKPTDTPIYILYYKGKCVGASEKFSNHKLNININNALLSIEEIKSKAEKKRILHITDKDKVILTIKKDRLRYGKKNIYEVFCDDWTYDEDLMMLLVAFCDVAFFPEWPVLRWNAMEYDFS